MKLRSVLKTLCLSVVTAASVVAMAMPAAAVRQYSSAMKNCKVYDKGEMLTDEEESKINTLLQNTSDAVDMYVAMAVYGEDLHYMLSRLEGCGSDWFTLVSSDEIKKDWLLCSVPTKHTEELDGRCFGYLLNVHGVNVVYTGDTSTILPFEKYLSEGTYLYTEMSAYKSPVHLYCGDMAEKIKAYKAAGVHVYLMHMDDVKKIIPV